MASFEIVTDLMKKVHAAVHSAHKKNGGAAYRQATLHVPGLATKLELPGVDVRDLLVPDCHIPAEERAAAFSEAITPLLEQELLGDTVRILIHDLGLFITRFTLLGETPDARLARLLWVFGKDQEKELGDNTLVVIAPSGEYGVRDGKFVGCIWAGSLQNLDLSSIHEETRIKHTRASDLVGIRAVLADRNTLEAYWGFCLLYAISEWDQRVIIDSLMKAKPKLSKKNLRELADIVMLDPDPYAKLHRLLVPACLTYSDFTRTFGKPSFRKQKTGVVKPRTRLALLGKLQSIPFL